MSHERKQATNDELRELLDACREVSLRVRLPGKRTAWNERVLALKEALDTRVQYPTEADKLLGLEIRRYLRAAGAL